MLLSRVRIDLSDLLHLAICRRSGSAFSDFGSPKEQNFLPLQGSELLNIDIPSQGCANAHSVDLSPDNQAQV